MKKLHLSVFASMIGFATAAVAAPGETDPIKRFVSGFEAGSGGAVAPKLQGCAQNPNPADPDQILDSCMYMIGSGRILIVNALGSAVSDVAAQPWSNDMAGDAVGWIVGALGGATDVAAAGALVQQASTEGMADGDVAGINVVLIKLGDSLTVSAFPPAQN